MSKLSRFTEKPKVTNKVTLDNKDYITICTNIEEHIENIPNPEDNNSLLKQVYWTANINEIIAPKDILNYEFIKNNPEKYINYKYIDSSSITYNDRVNVLEDTVAELINILVNQDNK